MYTYDVWLEQVSNGLDPKFSEPSSGNTLLKISCRTCRRHSPILILLILDASLGAQYGKDEVQLEKTLRKRLLGHNGWSWDKAKFSQKKLLCLRHSASTSVHSAITLHLNQVLFICLFPK